MLRETQFPSLIKCKFLEPYLDTDPLTAWRQQPPFSEWRVFRPERPNRLLEGVVFGPLLVRWGFGNS